MLLIERRVGTFGRITIYCDRRYRVGLQQIVTPGKILEIAGTI